jgi:hypothetical protein
MPEVVAVPLLAGFSEVMAEILNLLCCSVWVVLNLWLFQKTKAVANLLMMLGAAYILLHFVFVLFGGLLGGPWMLLLAFSVVTAGFFLSVRAQVEAQLTRMRQRIQEMTSGKKDGSAPPPGAAAPPAAGAPPA